MSVSDLGREAAAGASAARRRLAQAEGSVASPVSRSFSAAAPSTPRCREGVASTGLRAALARWLTRKDHPLTARVMVNRLWQHHFGVGIVATPATSAPWAMRRPIPNCSIGSRSSSSSSGWSLKHMHRLMVMSAAYCQDSTRRSATTRCTRRR